MALFPSITGSHAIYVSSTLTKTNVRASVASKSTRESYSIVKSSISSPQAVLASRRSFWWGRHGYRNKYPAMSYSQKCMQAYGKVTKFKTGKVSSRIDPPSHPLPFYQPSPGARQASSWGRHDGEGEKDAAPKESERGEEQDWVSERRKRQEEIQARLEKLSRMIEEDPYGTLFAGSFRRGAWNPFDSWRNTLRLIRSEWAKDDGEGSGDKAQSSATKEQAVPGGFMSNKATSTQEPAVKNDNHAPTSSRTLNSSDAKKAEALKAFDIDLISLRRVPRDTSQIQNGLGKPVDHTTYNIPVKTFNSSLSTQNQTSNGGASAESWLTREGFSTTNKQPTQTPENFRAKEERQTLEKDRGDLRPKIQSSLDRHVRPTTSTIPIKERPTIIESSLDRHARPAKPPVQDYVSSRKPLEYKFEENKTEDIDLLRASDIRASAGHVKKPSKHTKESKEERRRQLEKSFEQSPQSFTAEGSIHEHRFAKRKAENKTVNTESARTSHDASESIPHLQMSDKISQLNPLTDNADAYTHAHDMKPAGLQTSYQDELDKKVQSLESHFVNQHQQINDSYQGREPENLRKKERDTQKAKAVKDALAEEIKVQKTAMAAMESRRHEDEAASHSPSDQGEGDMATNIHQFAGRERWYKMKAPHAIGEVHKATRLVEEQKKREKSLVREIRQIYEDQYGTISTTHRQTPGNPPMEGEEYCAVREGLREYDEKIAREKGKFLLYGKLASTDLSNSEVLALRSRSTMDQSQNSSQTRKPSGKEISNGVESNVQSKRPQDSTLQRLEAQMTPEKKISSDNVENNPQLKKPQDLVPQRPGVQMAPKREIPTKAENNLQSKKPQDSTSQISQAQMTPENEKEISNNTENNLHLKESQDSTSQRLEAQTDSTVSRKPIIYKILALNSRTNEVTSATTVSSLWEGSGPPRSAAAILSHLSHPEKYFSHIETLGAAGFELVSGGRSSLVYKLSEDQSPVVSKIMQDSITDFLKVASVREQRYDAEREDHGSSTSAPFSNAKGYDAINPVDGTSAIPPSSPPLNQTLQHSSVPDSNTSKSTLSSRLVNREEELFSGSRINHYRPDISKSAASAGGREEDWANPRPLSRRSWSFGRMLLNGLSLAMLAYLIGIFFEYKRLNRDKALTEEYHEQLQRQVDEIFEAANEYDTKMEGKLEWLSEEEKRLRRARFVQKRLDDKAMSRPFSGVRLP